MDAPKTKGQPASGESTRETGLDAHSLQRLSISLLEGFKGGEAGLRSSVLPRPPQGPAVRRSPPAAPARHTQGSSAPAIGNDRRHPAVVPRLNTAVAAREAAAPLPSSAAGTQHPPAPAQQAPTSSRPVVSSRGRGGELRTAGLAASTPPPAGAVTSRLAQVAGAPEGGAPAAKAKDAGRGSVAMRDLRESVMALLSARQQLASKIADGTPTIIPLSDRQAVLQVLEQAPGQRGGPKELAPVLRMLQKVPFLAELEMQALTEIARWVRYLSMEAGRVVFNQGDVGTLFYIIASGKVAVTVTGTASATAGSGQQQQPPQLQREAPPQPPPLPQQAHSPPPQLPLPPPPQQQPVEIVLEAGATFGEKALSKPGMGRRTATVATLTECKLLTLDLHQYNALLAKVHEEELVAKVEVLRRFEVASGWTEQQLREVAGVLTLRKFPADRVVLHQGAPSNQLFFIKRGEVRVVRHLPSTPRLRLLLSNSVMAAQFQPDTHLRNRLKETALTQSNPSGGQLSARSAALELYHHMLPLDGGQEGPEDVYVEIATLGPNEVFGEVGAPEGEWRRASIITSTFTELLELARHDLLTRLKGSCRVALEALAEQYASDEALLESVAQEVEWQRYRHRLVAGVLWQGDRLSHMVPYHRQRG